MNLLMILWKPEPIANQWSEGFPNNKIWSLLKLINLYSVTASRICLCLSLLYIELESSLQFWGQLCSLSQYTVFICAITSRVTYHRSTIYHSSVGTLLWVRESRTRYIMNIQARKKPFPVSFLQPRYQRSILDVLYSSLALILVAPYMCLWCLLELAELLSAMLNIVLYIR